MKHDLKKGTRMEKRKIKYQKLGKYEIETLRKKICWALISSDKLLVARGRGTLPVLWF
jgi:hypothetical protein